MFWNDLWRFIGSQLFQKESSCTLHRYRRSFRLLSGTIYAKTRGLYPSESLFSIPSTMKCLNKITFKWTLRIWDNEPKWNRTLYSMFIVSMFIIPFHSRWDISTESVMKNLEVGDFFCIGLPLGGITWFSGQTESVVADRVLNWGDYKNWMPRYLLSWFVSFQVKLRQAMWLFKLQWHGMMRNGMGCYDMTWYFMVWHGMVQNGIAWHEMRWRDIILLCITWDHLALHGRHGIHDMEFHGMEWHDVARFVKWKLI